MNALSSQGFLASPPPLVYSYGMRGYYPPFHPSSTDYLTERSSPLHTDLTNQDMDTRRASQGNQKNSEKTTVEVQSTNESSTEDRCDKNDVQISDDEEGRTNFHLKLF